MFICNIVTKTDQGVVQDVFMVRDKKNNFEMKIYIRQSK